MLLDDLIKKDLILLNMEADSRKDAFIRMATLLKENGYVKDTYLEGIEKREEIYPTGIELPGGFFAAIPHTDPNHVSESAICLGILREPVRFRSIENREKKLPVRNIFMIALNREGKQVEVLESLMALLQNQEFMVQLEAVNTPQEVKHLLEQYTQKEGDIE